MNNVILEGPDLIGKTTLADQLLHELCMVDIRKGIQRVGPETVVATHEQDLESHQQSIFDRCYLVSDVVYEKVYGRESVFEKYLNRMMTEMLTDNILVIMYDGSSSILRERYKKRGDELQALEQILAANDLYKQLAARYISHENVIVYDIATMDKNITDAICRYLKAKGGC